MNRTRLLLIGFVALALGTIVSYSVYRTLQSKTGGDAALLLNPDYADALGSLETGWGPEECAQCLNTIERTRAGLKLRIAGRLDPHGGGQRRVARNDRQVFELQRAIGHLIQ